MMRRVRRNLKNSIKYLNLALELRAQKLSREDKELVEDAIELLKADIEYNKEMIGRKGMEELTNTCLNSIGNVLNHSFEVINQYDVFERKIHDECDKLLNEIYMDLEKIKNKYFIKTKDYDLIKETT